jgi:hypothetical protein
MATVTEELLILIKSVGGIVAAGEVDKVSAATARSGRAAKEATKEHYGFKSALGSLKGIAFQAAGLAGIGGLALGAHEAIKNAQEMQVASSNLGQAIKNNVQYPAKDAGDQMKEFAEHLAVTGGFNPVDAISSMTRLLFVTKDVGKAQKDMELASNIARGAHVSLQQATRAVSMVEAGRTTGLSRMGIFLSQVKTAQQDLSAQTGKHTQAQKDLAKQQDQQSTRVQGLTTLWQKYGHTTDAYSKTAAGSISNLRNTVEILTEKLGAKLLPIVTHVAQAVTKFVEQMQSGTGAGGQFVKVLKDIVAFVKDLWKWVKDLWPVLAGLVAVWVAWNVAMKITKTYLMLVAFVKDLTVAFEALKAGQVGVAIAQVGLNAAILTSPIFWIVGTIILLVAAFAILWIKVKGFRDFWKDAWKWIKQAAKDVFDWIVTAANNVAQWVSNAFRNAKKWITGAIHDVIAWLKQNWPIIVGILLGPIAFAVAEIIKHWKQVKKLPGELLKTLKDVGNDIANALIWPFKFAFNWVKKHLPSFHVHHIGPIPIPLPSFPGLASGGVTPYGGAFVVGERGPELVTLPQGASVSSQDDLKQTNALLRELILAVQTNSQALIVDGKVLAQSVMRQGLLQTSRS